MPCCCGNILNLCNKPVCGTLQFFHNVDAPESGVENIYTLQLDYLETTVVITQLQIVGQLIRFDIGKLNENFQYTGQIFDSNGDLVKITIGGLDYDCIKFKTIISINAETQTAVPPVLNIPGTVVIESFVDENIEVTGTLDAVAGITAGSNTITSNAFSGVRVVMIRGILPLPGIDPGDGDDYFTKALESDFITLSHPLTAGEFIRIQTIPQ